MWNPDYINFFQWKVFLVDNFKALISREGVIIDLTFHDRQANNALLDVQTLETFERRSRTLIEINVPSIVKKMF